MPKLNYGFKGNSLTAAQAVAAGAVTTSQDYQYIVQLGAVTPLTAPSEPTNVSATPGGGRVALSWSAPSSAGSSAVTGYQIVYVADDGTEVTTTTSGTSKTITGLTAGTNYSFAVTAVNASAGAGSPASVGASPVDLTVPVPSSVSWVGEHYTSSFSVSNSTITVTDINSSTLEFTMPAATLTVTRITDPNVGSFIDLSSTGEFAASYLDKEGRYHTNITNYTVSGSKNLPAGTYWLKFMRFDPTSPANFTVVLS